MKKIPIGTFIYEFECDSTLLNQVHEEISTSDKIIWAPKIPPSNIKNVDTATLNTLPLMGYMDKEREVSYYHPKLFNWFDDCISKVVADTIPDTTLTINEAWLNKLKFGQHHSSPHYHRLSVYSGLLYLTTHPGSSFTNFFPQNDAVKIMNNYLNFGKPLEANNTRLPKDAFLSAPLAGKLLIFPSDLMHSISTHTDIKNLRYTLAFNTFWEGTVGHTTSTLNIKVKSVKETYEEFLKKNQKVSI
jgi:uncharacterized protein (TIGR02466 family)